MKQELRNILESETDGTGELADSLTVTRGNNRGKPIIQIKGALHARPFFRGTTTSYANIPPNAESAHRFGVWAAKHSFRPRRLAKIIAMGKSTGNVYKDRTNILVRAMRAGFKDLRS